MGKMNAILSKLGEVKDIVFKDMPFRKNHGGGQKDAFIKAVWKYYGAMTKIDYNRKIRYSDYEEQLKDGISQSALELLTEDATAHSIQRQESVWCNSDTDAYIQEWERFKQAISLDDNYYDWVWQTCFYGDFFVRIYGEPGKGIVEYDDDAHPEDCSRFDINGRLYGFSINEDLTNTYNFNPDNLLEPWEVIHFRLLGPRKKVKVQDKIHTMGTNQIDSDTGRALKITTKYGTGYLEASRKIFKQLNLAQDSMIMARLARAPFVRVFYISVGNTTVEDGLDTVSKYEELFSSSKSFDADKDHFYNEYNPMNYQENVFLPVFANDKGNMRVDTIGGDVDVQSMVDIEYVTKIYFGTLRCPPEYLGFTNEGFQVGDGSLKYTSLRYSRMVKRVQKAVLISIKRMFLIHLSYRFKKVINPTDFDLESTTTSSADDKEVTEAIKGQLEVATQILNFFTSLGIQNQTQIRYISYWLLNYLQLPDFKIKEFLTGKIDFEKVLLEKNAKKVRIRERKFDSYSDVYDPQPFTLVNGTMTENKVINNQFRELVQKLETGEGEKE